MRILRRSGRLGVVWLLWACLGFAAPGVTITPLSQPSAFADATDADAIAFACAADSAALSQFFAENKLPFESAMVRPRGASAACHVYYEPTLKGFRASRDNEKIRGLYAAIDPLSFFLRGDLPGYSLDIAKSVLSRLPRPVDVRLSVSGNYDQSLWTPTAEIHFAGSPNRFSFFDSGTSEPHPWAQDHIKAGHLNGQLRVLIPRRLFEGRQEDGELTKGMLSRLEQERFVRSKLSWDGGGVQFVADPKDPSKTIMAVGGGMRYWGEELSQQEFAYVLRVEFGADKVLDLSAIGPHADYLVAFLPEDNTVLVSNMVRRSGEAARAAAFALLDSFGDEKPAPIRRLASLLAEWPAVLSDRPPQIMAAIAEARRTLGNLAPESDRELDGLMEQYVARHCPANPAVCFEGVQANRLLQTDPELARRAAGRSAVEAVNSKLRPMLLDLIEAQTSIAAWREEPLLEDAVRQLEQFGFRTVRVPHLSGGEGTSVSYVNSLLFDRRLFVPSLGLGGYEERLFAKLKNDLGGRYEILPVNARTALALDGGVHCVFGIIREVGGPVPARAGN
jgi:hypothetical protein